MLIKTITLNYALTASESLVLDEERFRRELLPRRRDTPLSLSSPVALIYQMYQVKKKRKNYSFGRI